MINGILLLDKPLGLSSHRALHIVKRALGAKKAGHGGSLDPAATGLLPLYFGEAVKFSRFSLEADKEYVVTALLGKTTDSGDATGNVLLERPISPNLSLLQIETILEDFKGPILQIPPMYSAIKHQGQPLYKQARKGVVIERKPREIVIYDLKLQNFSQSSLQPTFELRVQCSKGTYIRTLIEDIGEGLGCGAHVQSLRRLAAGPYQAEQMVQLDYLQSLSDAARKSLMECLLPIETALKGLPALILSADQVLLLQQGQSIPSPKTNVLDSGWVVLKTEEQQFFGVGWLEEGRIIPKRLLAYNMHL